MNRWNVPKIPPLLIDNKFIINCGEKATTFSEYFSQLCKPNVNDRVLPHLEIFTEMRRRTVEITINSIEIILNSLNPTKIRGPYNITIRMLLLCGESTVLPLRHILHNSLSTGVYPDTWKETNVTPIS